MRIIGGIFPFIGWRTIEVDSDGMPCDCIVERHWKADALEVEWLNRGVILYVGKVRAA